MQGTRVCCRLGEIGEVTRKNPAESFSIFAGYPKCRPIFGYLRSRRLKPKSASLFPISPGPHSLRRSFTTVKRPAVTGRTMTSLPSRPIESHRYAARRARCLYAADKFGRPHSQSFVGRYLGLNRPQRLTTAPGCRSWPTGRRRICGIRPTGLRDNCGCGR
jgi:hypothetical protein